MSFSHFCSLFHKNLIILKRTYILTSIEIISPILVMFLFYIFKSLFETENLEFDPDKDYIILNGTLVKNMENNIFSYRNNIEEDLMYRGMVHNCINKFIALIGEDFPREIKQRLEMSRWEIFNASLHFEYFHDIKELYAYIKKNNVLENNSICFGISFSKNFNKKTEKTKYVFKLHYPASPYSTNSLIPSTNIDDLDPFRSQPDFKSYKKYINHGFLNVHKILYDYVLRKETNNPEAEINYRLIPQKYDKYLFNILDEYLSILLGIFILVAYAFPLSINIYRLIKDKESRAKEIMKMMGLSELNYFFANFILYFIINIIYSICNAFILSASLNYIKTIYLFIFFLLYGLVIFSLVFFFKSFLEKTAISIILSLIIYSIQFFLFLIFQENAISRGVKIFIGIIFPPITMQLGVNTFCNFQKNYKYMNSDIYLRYNKFSICDMYIIFACNILIYMFFGFYLQNILPQKFGITQPFYFLFTKSYWGCNENNSHKLKNDNNNNNDINDNKNTMIIEINNRIEKYNDEIMNSKYVFHNKRINSNSNDKNNYYFEETKQYENYVTNKDVLEIENIKKSFGNKIVLNGLSFKLYRNEIFVLLGHNGAGKTVLLNILTGLLKADSGNVIYNSCNILTPSGLKYFHKIIGICPQEDILFEHLTVEEHLNIFCKFKSVPNVEIEEEITKVLHNLDFTEKRFTKVSNLSGGQKRKLSIALALIGGSSIIFLDEPTSGMDITTRRNLWDILKRSLNGKIIILTTHFMEEASVLGNRIGILSDGKMQCIGSPLFLINKLTKNIKLNITKNFEASDESIIKFIKENIDNPNKSIEYEIFNNEILFKIEYNKSNINWSVFFEKFDSQLENLNIKNYSISMPTLEDVFIKLSKLSKQNEENEIENTNRLNNDIIYDQNNYYPKNDKIATKIIQGLIVSFMKRLLQIIREKKAFIIEIVCPILLTLIGCIVGYIQILDENRVFPFHLNQITNDSQILLYSMNDINNNNYVNISNDIFINFSNEDLRNINFQNIQSNIDFSNYFLVNSFANLIKEHFKIRQELKGKSYVYYVISEINREKQKYEFLCIIDITARQAAPIYPNFLLNNFVRFATQNKNLEIEIINEPLPFSKSQLKEEENVNKFMVLFFTSLAFSLIPSNFITIIIKEKENNSKHLQIVSGISLFSYWVINYIFELIKYYIIGGICLFILYLFDFYEKYLYILYLEYGSAMTSFTYLLSILFKSEDIGQIIVLLINLVIGVLGGTSIIIMRLNKDLKNLSKIIIYIFRIIPSFCFCFGYNQLIRREDLFTRDDRFKYEFNINSNSLDDIFLLLDYIGADCVYLAIETIFYLILLIIIENIYIISNFFKNCSNCCKKTNIIDYNNDIEMNVNSYSISVHNLAKVYYDKCYCCNKINAINNISFNLKYGEIFGFLGVNGAGKTTTFKCLSNEIYPNSGSIYIDKLDVTKHFNKIRNLIGYCPQYDAIFDYLTVYENLKFYGLIKGAKKEKLSLIIKSLIDLMNLKEFTNIKSGNLSGGNKRKLSVAIALICNPPIILLDEPSTGMDPEARRYMWKVIHNISIYRKKSTIIMTTHSMEEAETLCKKIGIITKGEFKCIGTCDEIKDKFGYGFEINFQINQPDINDVYDMFYVSDEDKEQIIYLNYLDNCFKIYYFDKYKTQLKKGLFGDKILSEINSKGFIPFKKILLWIYNLKCVLGMIKIIKEYFNEIICVDFGENNFFFNVKRYKTKEEKSIGFLFGLIEGNKNKYNIGPYFIRYSSLEQIFNKFAKENEKLLSNDLSNEINIKIDNELLDNFLN